MKKKKLIKNINKIIIKKDKAIEIDFADESYSIVDDLDKDLYELTGQEKIEYIQDFDQEMFPEVEFYDND